MHGTNTILQEVVTQVASRPRIPASADFSSQTIVVTGANVGLGKEAARHFVRLNAAKVIIAVRSVEKGTAAAQDIEETTGRQGVVETWELDYSKYASVKAFCGRLAQESRVDAVVLNAGVATMHYERFEDDESTITVNVISTALLMLLILPILRASATKWNIVPTLAVTSSRIHVHASFPERKAPNSLEALSDPQTNTMHERYQTSKLLQVMVVREIADRTSNCQPFVIVNMINPGLCKTSLTRSTEGAAKFVMDTMKAMLAWTAEEGSRTIVHAVMAGPTSHGAFLSECQLKNHWVASWLLRDERARVQKKIWDEVSKKLETIQPGVLQRLVTHGVN